MHLKDSVVFVTGANRGIGAAFVRESLARGARKVYAAVRDPHSLTIEGCVPVKLDVTRAEDVAAAAKACTDVTLVVNNAGIAKVGTFMSDQDLALMRLHLETNFFGVARVSLAFAPVLAANGGGGIVNVLSISSWTGAAMLNVYGASKAAAWGFTNSLRRELSEQKTQVLALHMGMVETDMTQGFDFPKSSPEFIVKQAFDGLEAGADEVLADERTQRVKEGLSSTPASYVTGSPPR